MKWINRNPAKQKRILMITPDIMIDRRILIEAETLIDDGFEVYLLAGWNGQNEHETIGRVRVERIKFEGLDTRLKQIYKLQSTCIQGINKIMITNLNKANAFSSFYNNASNAFLTKSFSFFNKLSLKLQKIFNKLATNMVNRRLIYKILIFCQRIALKSVTLSSKCIYCFILLLLKIVRKLLNIGLYSTNFLFKLAAKLINKLVFFSYRIMPLISGLTAYENEYLRKVLFYRPDIIHVHDLPMLKIGANAKKLLKKATMIYDMHEFYPEQDVFTTKQRKRLRKTEKKYLPFCEVALTVNPLLAEEISRAYGGINISIIQNAIPLDSQFHNKTYDLFRYEYQISKNDIIILYQGWISPHRNLQNMVQGLKYVSKPIKLILMGYGEFIEDLKVLANNNHVGDKIVFVPAKPQEELLYYTASADIGIIPYPYKLDPNTKFASPNKLYEFIAARVPILCNSLPFVKGIVEKNEFGVAYNLETPEDFAYAFESFPYDKLHLFKENLKNHGPNYLWDKEANKLLKIYSQII
jgi:glycosyltransferase involved in cell wall biosynthesis